MKLNGQKAIEAKQQNESVVKIQIYRETEIGIEYLNASGCWVDNSTDAILFDTKKAAQSFASENGEDISASYDEIEVVA